MILTVWYRFDAWNERHRAARLRRLARFCRKVSRNADNLADTLTSDVNDGGA